MGLEGPHQGSLGIPVNKMQAKHLEWIMMVGIDYAVNLGGY